MLFFDSPEISDVFPPGCECEDCIGASHSVVAKINVRSSQTSDITTLDE